VFSWLKASQFSLRSTCGDVLSGGLMAKKKRHIPRVTGVKDRKLVEHGVAVQAWVPKEVYMQFRKKYPRRGAVSILIRKAFLLAVEDNHQYLPPAQGAEGTQNNVEDNSSVSTPE
jgi:hypothetical protein